MSFLDEASLILGRPGLKQVAEQFRDSAQAWDRLSYALLPDEVEPFGETRRILLKRHWLFLEQGSAALEEISQIDQWLSQIRSSMEGDFPLDAQEVQDFWEGLRERVLAIHDIEKEAIEALQSAIS